jgi:hypothetical protein
MKSATALLAGLAVVGKAETATLRTKGFYGNTLSQMQVDYNAGESFMASVDLGVSTDTLKMLELEVGTYGVNKCTFMMRPQGKNGKEEKRAPIPVGHFDDTCAWPNVSYVSRQPTVYKLNVENIWQFYSDVHLYLECEVMDVTLAKSLSSLGCDLNKDDTVQNNQLENIYDNFEFSDVVLTDKVWTMNLAIVYLSNLADIFLGGLNPLLDVVIKGSNAAVYKGNMIRLAQSSGWLPLHEDMLMGKKHKKEFTQDDIDSFVDMSIKVG